ncbi:MAG: glutathione S-transferase family protein [Acidobacteriota bacterium]
MSQLVKMFDLAPSPNNIKVRLALGFKKIPYERIPVDFEDREPVIRASGQPLAPALLHGDTVIFESGAILRYLEGNFRDTPRLFSSDREVIHQIEEWENWARQAPSQGVGICFRESFSENPSRETLAKARALLHTAADRLEASLADHPFLLGDTLTAADLFIAPWIHCGLLPPATPESFPPIRFLTENFRLEGHPRTRDWTKRIMSYDRS